MPNPTAPVTVFRQAVMEVLADALGINVVPGRLLGPTGTRDLACVYPSTIVPWEQDKNVQTTTLVVDLYKQFLDYPDPESPYDPTALEQLAYDATLALKAAWEQVGEWAIEVSQTSFDVELQSVQLEVVGTSWSDFMPQ